MFGLPHSLLVTAASYGVAFMLGMAAGNVMATRHALDVAQARADAQFAAATGAIAEELKRRAAALAAQERRATAAEEAAHAALTAGHEEAERASGAALKQLARERKISRDLADAYMDVSRRMDSGSHACGWSGAARRVLDAAAGAAPAGDPASGGGAAPAPPGVIDGPVAASAAPAAGGWLSCEDLYRGYVALGRWARAAQAKDDAWQVWARHQFED